MGSRTLDLGDKERSREFPGLEGLFVAGVAAACSPGVLASVCREEEGTKSVRLSHPQLSAPIRAAVGAPGSPCKSLQRAALQEVGHGDPSK